MKGNLLNSLKKVRWNVAFKTFGSSHSTLIGLLVEWWITNGRHKNGFALESGCTFKSHKKGNKSKRCDAVLVEGDNDAHGIVEVEGSRYRETIRKIGDFFRSERFKNLKFGIFLAYSTTGSARDSFYFDPSVEKMIEEGKKTTQTTKGKELVLLFLEKEYEKSFENKKSLRSLNSYYRGTPSKVVGVVLCDGDVICRQQTIWP